MDKILVGSSALNYWCEKLKIKPKREPRDLDFYLRGVGKKIHNKEEDSHGVPEQIFDYIAQHPNSIKENGYVIPSYAHLYTIKLSHSFFPIKWVKTASDIIWMQGNLGQQIPDPVLFDMLYDFWLITHKNHKDKINLMKTNEEFFKDRVNRVYVHDDIHAVISAPDEPMYYKMKSDKSKAYLSKDDFNKFHFHEKLRLCQEEITVTGIERFLIPSEYRMSNQLSYEKGLENLVTSMSKGWFPKFIMEKLLYLKKCDGDLFDKFYKAKDDKLIRKIQWDTQHNSTVS